MYVKSNTNKSTSLFESLKSHSATARKLLEKKTCWDVFVRIFAPKQHTSAYLDLCESYEDSWHPVPKHH